MPPFFIDSAVPRSAPAMPAPAADPQRHAPTPASPGATRAAATPLAAALLLMMLSGFAGLGEQIVWTQQLGVGLGHDIVAVLAVVAAFFGGIALGAMALSARIAASPRPARWYAGCEAVIGVWGLALTALMPAANAALAALTGPTPSAPWQWTVAFFGPLLLLLPATCAMGATLPAITRLSRRLRDDGFAIGGLYAANTFGAVIGVLASAFVLVPWLGLVGSARLCAALNLVCAVLVFVVAAPARDGAGRVGPEPVAPRSGGRGVLGILFATGALGIGYEVVVVRVLSQVAEDTVYTFALLLAVYLLGTAAGAAYYQRRLAAHPDGPALRARLLAALAAACLLGALSLWGSETLKALLVPALGGSYAAALASEALIAVAAFVWPTCVMGALFSHLCVEAEAAGRGLGAALGANTLGAAFAPFGFAVVAVPWWGAKAVLLLIAGAYLLCIDRRRWVEPRVWAPAVATLAVALLAPRLAFVDVPDGGRSVSFADGVMASVSVVADADGVMRLRIDNRQQEGSSASVFADARQAWLPLLLHPAPARALFLGLGTGITAGAAALDRSLRVDAVELLPEVAAAAALFRPALDAPADAPQAQVSVGDARRHVRTTDQLYDVIVADLFHPARSGAGALYTTEHFAAIRGRLAPGGLFCQWLPLHQLDLGTLASIVRSFTAVYPDAFAILATNSLETPVIGLVARPGAAPFTLDALRARRAAATLPAALTHWQLADAWALLGSVIADADGLRAFGAGAPLNTDDRPVVAHQAPRLTYAPDSLPRERLLALLHALPAPRPQALLGATGVTAEADGAQGRLDAYWSARTRFLELGAGARPDADVRVMLAHVGAPLLDIVRSSADFRPAYDPLLQMARALARTDPAGALDLLAALAAANPARPDAERLREALRRAALPP